MTPEELVGIGPDRLREVVLGMRPERVVVKVKLLDHVHGALKHSVAERPRDWVATTDRQADQMTARGLSDRLRTGRPMSGVKLIDNLPEVSLSFMLSDLFNAGYLLTEVFWQAHHSDPQRFFLWICFDQREKAEGYDAGVHDVEEVPEATRAFILRFLHNMPWGYTHVHANVCEYKGRVYRLDMVDCVAAHVKRRKLHVDPARRVQYELRFLPDHTYRADSLEV